MAPECPEVNVRQTYEDDFKKKIETINKNTSKLIAEVDEILDKKNVNKGDKERLRTLAKSIKNSVEVSVPFISEQYNEQMDKVGTEVKAEVEAFTLNRVTSLGIQKLEDLGEGAPPALPDSGG